MGWSGVMKVFGVKMDNIWYKFMDWIYGYYIYY